MFRVLVFLIGQLCLYLSFPNQFWHISILAMVCMVPLLWLLNQTSAKMGFLWAWAYFQLFFVTMFFMNPFENWQRFQSLATISAFVSFYVLYPMAYGALILAFSRFKTGRLNGPLLAAAIWVLFEYSLTKIPIGFPLSFGITQYQSPLFLQLASIFGIFGISGVLIFCNVGLANSVIRASSDGWAPSKIVTALSVIVAIIIIVANYAWELSTTSVIASPSNTEMAAITLVQPNLRWSDAFRSHTNDAMYQSQVVRISDLINRVPKSHPPGTLILPEWVLAKFDPNDSAIKGNFLPSVSGYQDVIFGTQMDQHPTLLQYVPARNQISNSILKQKTVPFFESNSSRFLTDSELILNSPPLGLIPLNCFEILFPIKDMGSNLQATRILGGVSFNTWLGNTNWPILHMSYFPIRAAEAGLPGFFLNNNGPSIVVNAQGKITHQLPLGKPGWITFYPNNSSNLPSLYSRIGDWLIIISAIIVGVRGLRYFRSNQTRLLKVWQPG